MIFPGQTHLTFNTPNIITLDLTMNMKAVSFFNPKQPRKLAKRDCLPLRADAVFIAYGRSVVWRKVCALPITANVSLEGAIESLTSVSSFSLDWMWRVASIVTIHFQQFSQNSSLRLFPADCAIARHLPFGYANASGKSFQTPEREPSVPLP